MSYEFEYKIVKKEGMFCVVTKLNPLLVHFRTLTRAFAVDYVVAHAPEKEENGN